MYIKTNIFLKLTYFPVINVYIFIHLIISQQGYDLQDKPKNEIKTVIPV